MRSPLPLVRSNRYNGVTGVTSWHPPVASAPSVGAPTPATPAVSGPAAATLSATLVSVDAPAAKPAATVAAAVASAPSKGSLGIAAQLMRSKKAKEAHELSKAKEKSDGPDRLHPLSAAACARVRGGQDGWCMACRGARGRVPSASPAAQRDLHRG